MNGMSYDLNFVIKTSLKINNHDFSGIYIAQGHNALSGRNDWWFGCSDSPSCSFNSSSGSIILNDGDKSYSLKASGISTFEINYDIDANNEVVFKKGTGVDSLDIEYVDKNVTLGEQSGDKIFTVNTSDDLIVYFKSGRKASDSVAKWFINSITTDGGMTATNTWSASSPSELNLALRTTLVINGSPIKDKFYIAQGHRFLINNWWIGSPGGKLENRNLILETEDGKKYSFIPYDHSTVHNYFTVNKLENPNP